MTFRISRVFVKQLTERIGTDTLRSLCCYEMRRAGTNAPDLFALRGACRRGVREAAPYGIIGHLHTVSIRSLKSARFPANEKTPR